MNTKKTNHQQNCSNTNCNKTHKVGSNVMYDNNYNIYCNNGECSNGVKTIGKTHLEECWFN